MFPLFAAIFWACAALQQQFERLVLAVLGAGPIPQHIAYIMDGNRRFARARGKPPEHGHFDGFESLKRMLEACLRLRIRCVSVFAFSIENFKRPSEEVNALMQLAEQRFCELCEKGSLLDEWGVRVCIVGRKELLPPRVRMALERAENITRHNDRAILNLCMPYTSRDEMAAAMEKTVAEAVKSGADVSTITESAIDSHLYTAIARSPPVDVLVRSSGVRRLSDFLLWQTCSGTHIHFVDALWPELDVMSGLIRPLLAYQRAVWGARRRERQRQRMLANPNQREVDEKED